MNWKKLLIWLWPVFALLMIPLTCAPVLILSPLHALDWTILKDSYILYMALVGDILKEYSSIYVHCTIRVEPREIDGLMLNPYLVIALLLMISLIASFWFWFKKPDWPSAFCTLFAAWVLCGYIGLSGIMPISVVFLGRFFTGLLGG